MTANLRAALRAFEITMKTRVVSPWAYLNAVFFPIIVTAIGLFVLGSQGSSRTVYAALGGGLIGYWTAAYLDGGNSIGQERWDGTLEQLMGVPTPLWVILAGKIVASLLLGLLSFVPALVLAYVGFHARLPALDVGPFLIAFVALTISFFAIAMLFSPMFALWRWAFSLTNGFELGIWVFGGFMFPLAFLPGWAQAAAVVVAPAWATRALYVAAGHADRGSTALWVLWSLALSAVYIALSLLLYQVVERRARISGQLATA